MAVKKTVVVGTVAIAAVLLAGGAWLLRDGGAPRPAAAERADAASPTDQHADANTIELSETQLALVKVDVVGAREFPIEKTAVGSIDFDEDMTVPVFTPYQGRIVGLFAKVGDDVNKGQTLFTIDSPDLLQAESNLIAAAGVLQLTSKNLERMRELYTTHAVSQKDLEQAVSDQQSAEGTLRAARDSVRLFGKTDAEIDRIIAERIADPKLVVPSPISGRITARNAAPGLFVQPGNPPAPYAVADISTMWMLANVAEADSPAFRVGQEVKVSVLAFPGRVFEGKITTIGASVDPATRRVLVRSEISDPQHQLRSGMFANFVIRTGDPARSPAVPHDGVVREGDGTMTVWVTTDRRRFVKRTVTIGLQHDGYDQILTGLKAGEQVATEGALFLSNALSTSSR
ncbi:MAG TPA: efflux RND transporter periplasmic adaptor subunit [Xanthobacteraceae bacterium]|nr:efflux RND transporter periplasmic adaptor subunit [Xanthobacteraceae bacterium]